MQRGPFGDELISSLLDSRYQVLHVLGEGGSGPVYRGLQRSTGQSVAIKILALQGLTPEVRERRLERFRREIAFCSSLYHPDIVRLVDSGELDENTRFAAFEYIPGTTLADLIRDEGMLKVQRARSLMCQLLPALAHAHACGITHRDLKPTNIMVTTDGSRDRVKILDFGISIATRDDAELERLTSTNEWVGTPSYAAPEQLRGHAIGAKADLYAWGLIAFECLTGEPLIQGRSLPEIVEAQLRPVPHVLPEPLASHRLGVLLARVLEKDPDRRIGDANQLLSLLERIPTDDLADAHGYLRDASAGPSSRPPAIVFDTLTDERDPGTIEIRHASVVCWRIALVGPGMSSNVEQLDSLIDDANAQAREVFAHFGASCSEAVGGYSLAYFGLARARDSDARLAMRAALEVVNRVEQMPHELRERGLCLRAHVGIHNGPVAMHVTGSARRQIDGVTASLAMNLAASQPLERGEVASRVLVSEDFQCLVARYAECRPCEIAYSVKVPWRSAPVLPYVLAGESRTGLRAEHSVFVGRERELQRLQQAYAESRGAAGKVLVLSGEPGIGKSRLMLELLDWAEAKGASALALRCLPEWQNAFLRPLAELMRQQLGTDELPSEGAGGRLELRLKELEVNLAEAVPLFCSWLSVPLPVGHAPLPWSPQKQRVVLHRLLVDVLVAWMERGAVLFVEDLHWADPSTLECLDALCVAARRRTSFVVMSTRPGLALPWADPPELVALGRLDDAAIAQMASSALPATPLMQREVADIVSRSDGVPLYAEELTIALRSHVPSSQVTTPAGSGFAKRPSVPATLRDLLFSRLDDVGSAKATAQLAATLGREFSPKVFAVLSDSDELAFVGDLEKLVSDELLVKQLRVDGPVYIFRHALIRDSAYDSMTSMEKRQAHARIARALERHVAELGQAPPDILAHHFESAGLVSDAIQYWLAAANKATLGSAFPEALAQLDRALGLLDELPADATRSAKEAELLLARGMVMVAKHGYADPDATRTFERVSAMVPLDGSARAVAFAARWGLWYGANATTRLDDAWQLVSELQAIADGSGDPALQVGAWEAACETSFCRGDFGYSVSACRRCEELYVFDQHRYLAMTYGDDPLLASLSFEALAELFRGRPREALASAERGLQHAERLGYPHLSAGMHAQAAYVHLIWGTSGATVPDLARAREHACVALESSRERGFAFWEVYGFLLDAATRIMGGAAGAFDDMKLGADLWRMGGASIGRCWQLAFLAQGYLLRGEHEAGLASVAEGLAFCERQGSAYFKAELHRTRAVLLLDPQNPARDVHAAREALDAGRAEARKLNGLWHELAVCLTRARTPELSTPENTGELSALLSQIPRSSTEPPLVLEARTLLDARGGALRVPEALAL